MRSSISSAQFDKKLKRFILLHAELKSKVIDIIDTLLIDPTPKKYKAHKLSSSLKGCYGVSITDSYRIKYAFDKVNIYLLNIGSHDEVY